MVIITMEMSGVTPIIHHFNSNTYVGNVEMIGEITVIRPNVNQKWKFQSGNEPGDVQ